MPSFAEKPKIYLQVKICYVIIVGVEKNQFRVGGNKAFRFSSEYAHSQDRLCVFDRQTESLLHLER